jgi:hypothetical protein
LKRKFKKIKMNYSREKRGRPGEERKGRRRRRKREDG